jgi:integrase
MARALTVKEVKNAKPGKTRREIADGGCRGLYLVVFPNGNRSWVFRYRHKGKPKKLTIGPAFLGDGEVSEPTLDAHNTLAGARWLAGEAALMLARDIDPSAAKLTEREAARLAAEGIEAANAMTVAVLARRFIRDHSMRRTRESSWRQTARLIGLELKGDELVQTKTGGEVLSRWGTRPAHSITRADVNELLRAIVERGAPVTSNRALAATRKMFNWGVSEDILPTTPCIGVTRKADEESRSRVLDDGELRLIWKAAGTLDYPWVQFFRLLILTMQRRNEVAGIQRAEIRTKDRLWIIPANRAKNGLVHEVQLPDVVMEILGSCPEIGEGGFFLTRYGTVGLSGFSKAKRDIDSTILKIQEKEAAEQGATARALPNWTLHDLRRTGASGLARLGVPPVVVERILNHKSGELQGVRGIYNRHQYANESRAAMDAWSTHVLKVVK